jgi:hypothetical protein
MGTRYASLVNESVTLGFRHLYGGTLSDVDHINGVRILDQNYQPIYYIPGSSIVKVGIGAYECFVPGTVFTYAALFHDVWDYEPLPGSGSRILRFDINVLTQYSDVTPDFNTLLNCTIANLTACALKMFYLWPVRSAIQNYYLPDALLQHFIDNSISYMQQKLGIPLRQMRVMTPPFDPNSINPPVKGVDYDEEGSLIQYSASSGRWATVRLPHSHIIRINRVAGIYNRRIVYHVPNEWIDGNEFKLGFFRIRPTQAGANSYIIDENGQFLEWMLLEVNGSNTVPGFWAVDYTYGSPDDKIPKDICDVIMKRAAIHILDQIGMEISRGIANRSASVDGLSSSITLLASNERSMFGSLVARYEADIADDKLLDMRRTYKGVFISFF